MHEGLSALSRDIQDTQPESAGTANGAAGEGFAGAPPSDRLQAQFRVRIAAAIFGELNAMEIEYAAISGYADYPEVISSDLDIVVGKAVQSLLSALLQQAASRCGARLISRLRYHNGQTYIFTLQQDGEVASLWCDTTAECRDEDRIWVSSEVFLQDRRLDSRNFYKAEPIALFRYHLIKKVAKGSLSDVQGSELTNVYCECSAAADTHLQHIFSEQSAKLLRAALVSGQWSDVQANLPALRRELYDRTPLASFQLRAMYRLREATRKLYRVCVPTGICVAILGPDGSGKSSVIEQYLSALGSAFRNTACFHLRPHLLRGSTAGQTINTDPHGQKPRGVIASTAKLLFLWADYVLGYYFCVRPLLMRSTLVVFDRYYQDLLVDARRFRYGGPRWLARLVGRLIPMPDLLLVLDAPADVLQARKQEVPAAESARQAQAYRDVAEDTAARGRAVLVDAARPLDMVVSQCAERTLDFMAKRTARRLRLE